jgi:hypothetical protein
VELEVPLGGGRLTAGVVKVGDTVRRPVSLASPFTAMLLSHLASAAHADVAARTRYSAGAVVAAHGIRISTT